MTIGDAISTFDQQHNNTYTTAEKIAWLNKVDWDIWKNIICTHEHSSDLTFDGYTSTTPQTTVLLAPPPYDSMYLRYMEAQKDYLNGEYARYNNSISVYNTDVAAFEKWYNRQHLHIGRLFKFY